MCAHGKLAGFQLPEKDTVSVWVVRVSKMRASIPSLAPFLSQQERAIATRFIHEADRERYVVAHGVVRDLLSRYLNIDPEALAFVTNKFGKPDLVSLGDRPPLRFNLAHSGDLVLCAVTLERRVGVDVERVRTDYDVMELAINQFADDEVRALRNYSATERPNAFFRCWTRKEAYIKARGEGLALALNQFAVTVSAEEIPKVCWSSDEVDAAKNWTMVNLETHPGYAAAVVVEGEAVQMTCCRSDYCQIISS